MKKLLLPLAIFGMCGSVSYAQQIEPFNYPVASDITKHNGWSKPTNNPSVPVIKVEDKELNKIGIIQTKSIRLKGESGQLLLNINSASGFEEGKTSSASPFYAAFPILVNEGSKDGFFCGLRSGSNVRYKIYIKNVSGGFQLGLQVYDESPVYDKKNTYAYNLTHQLVFKWKESIPRQADLYVTGADMPAIEPGKSQISLPSTNSAQKFPQFLINQFEGSDMYIGGIVIKNDWPVGE